MSGPLFDGLARCHEVKKTRTLADARERALKGIREEVSRGVHFSRTRIGVDDRGVTELEAIDAGDQDQRLLRPGFHQGSKASCRQRQHTEDQYGIEERKTR